MVKTVGTNSKIIMNDRGAKAIYNGNEIIEFGFIMGEPQTLSSSCITGNYDIAKEKLIVMCETSKTFELIVLYQSRTSEEFFELFRNMGFSELKAYY